MTGVLVGHGGALRGELRQAVTAAETAPVRTFQPSRGGPTLPTELVPEELTTWLKQRSVSSSGQGLLESIDTLRARGYVSHDLMLQNPEPLWMQALPDYTFEASRAGHSSDRIERLFRDLNEREAELDDTAIDEELVAGIGDDEQFALAAYLIADQLGFEARVGLGVRLDTADSSLSACEAGECRGEHMTAWLEVRDAVTGTWGVVDVTPQHEHAPSPDVVQRSEPENPTDVETQHAPTVPPPDPAPTDGDLDAPADDTGPGLWQRLWPVLKPVLGVFLLVTAAAVPLLIIVVLKWLRSRARRGAGDPRVRTLGVWDEYVDRRVDTGSPRQGTQTRREYASTVDSATAYALATRVDELAFSGQQILPQQAHEAWELLPESLAELQADASWWSRFRARISLKSLRRGT